MKYAVGVDLGGTTVKIGIFTEDAKIVSKWEIKTCKQENGKYILSDIVASVLENLKKNGIDKADVKGLGMGVPGAIQPDGSVHSCVNLGWAFPSRSIPELILSAPIAKKNMVSSSTIFATFFSS